MYLQKYKTDGKYFDLCIHVDTAEIYCHRLLVCEQSSFIAMLVQRAQTTKWPPVSDITLSLPNNFEAEDVRLAIDILYDNNTTIPTDRGITTLLCMNYLLLSDRLIWTTLSKLLPIDRRLTQNECNIIMTLYDNDLLKSELGNIITFYYPDLKSYCDNITVRYPFGEGSTEQWIHIPSLVDKQKVYVDIVGLKLKIVRHLYYYGGDYEEDDSIYIIQYPFGEGSLQITMIAYSKSQQPYVRTVTGAESVKTIAKFTVDDSSVRFSFMFERMQLGTVDP